MALRHCRCRNIFICVCAPCVFLFLFCAYVVVTVTVRMSGPSGRTEGAVSDLVNASPHFVAPGAMSAGGYAPIPGTFWNKRGHEALWSQLQLVVDRHFNPILRPGDATRGPSSDVDDLLRRSFSERTYLDNLRSNFSRLPRQLKRFVRHMRRRDYPVLLRPSGPCGIQTPQENERPLLLFAIKTKESSFQNRQAIRQTWGRAGWVEGEWGDGSPEKGGGYVRRVFLLGTRDSEEEAVDLSVLLKMESERFGDMLQWDFEDTFFNLTLKDVLLWSWFAESCGRTAFVFKGDDDVFVNTPRMVAYLLDQLKRPQANESMREFMVGDLIVAATPNRDKTSKYFIPDSFYSDNYPRYLGGGGVVYSGLVTQRLHRMSRRVHLFPIDDVYVGMCMLRLDAFPADHPAFLTFDFPEREATQPCSYHTVLLVHKRSPSQMVTLWANMTRTQTACRHVTLRSASKDSDEPKTDAKAAAAEPAVKRPRLN